MCVHLSCECIVNSLKGIQYICQTANNNYSREYIYMANKVIISIIAIYYFFV